MNKKILKEHFQKKLKKEIDSFKNLSTLYELEDAKGLFEMNRKYNGGNFFEYKINILKNENE